MAGIKQFAKDLLATEKLLRYSRGHRFIFSYHDIGTPGTDHLLRGTRPHLHFSRSNWI